MNISEIDKNFFVNSSLRREKVKAYDAAGEPFMLYGLLPPDEKDNKYKRLPKEIAKTVNDGVSALYADTAGGRIRFATDSDYIGVYAVIPQAGRMSHFAMTGSTGFDLYREENGKQAYVSTVMPQFDIRDGGSVAGEKAFDRKEMHEYTLNFPLYSEVERVYIVLDENAALQSPRKYKKEKPIVYYGSSITQGGCASRPGNAYQAFLSRRFDCDFINLGFSGNARGEDEIAHYINGLDMSVFVFDYDHNAPSVEHLKATHERMFKRIRRKNPTLPIVCVSMPTPLPGYEERREVIKATVNRAIEGGDKNVYFVNGCDSSEVFGAGDSVSVDGVHPNDLGFFCMAKIIGDVLEKILNK